MKAARVILVSGGFLALGAALAAPGALGLRHSPAAAAAADTAIVSRSIAFFEERLARDPGNYLIANQLVERYLLRFQTGAQLSDLARAEAVARTVLRLVPEPAGAWARLSGVMLAQHKFAQAFEAAERAVAEDTLDPAARGAEFDAAMAAGRYDLAEEALATLPRNTLAYRFRAAQWHSALGEMDAAFFEQERACRRLEQRSARPQLLAWCLTELAAIAHARTGAVVAESLLERALRVQPGYRAALEGLADLAQARQDWKRAERLYRRIAAEAHPDLYLRLAEVRRARGDREGAAAYEQAFLRVAGAPGAEALYGRELALFFAAQPATREAALAIALRDVARRPAVQSYDVLSWVRYRRGELIEALEASDSARARGAPSATMDLHRALILETLGRTAEAAELKRRAIGVPSLLEPHARSLARAESE